MTLFYRPLLFPRRLGWAIGVLLLLRTEIGGRAANREELSFLAPQPLFRDPVFDGAADPTVIWNPHDSLWYMLYTNRRANAPALNGVAWVHGTALGIATSKSGPHWEYKGVAMINYPGAVKDATWWAPAVVNDGHGFHMFVSYVPGTFADGWNHPRDILHFESEDLLQWRYISTLALSSHKVIDPGVLHMPDGSWRLWYKDEADHSSCHVAISLNLRDWTDQGKVDGLSDAGGEAPLPFHWENYYWLLRDITGGKHGLALYRSSDAKTWARVSTLLQAPGTGVDDAAVGHHGEVIISENRAYLFYFTHPGASDSTATSQTSRRSAIQVVELKYNAADNLLTVDRNQRTYINLKAPARLTTQSKYQE